MDIKNVYKISSLIEVLNSIEEKQDLRGRSDLLNEVEKFLNEWVEGDLNKNDSKSLQGENGGFLQKAGELVQTVSEIPKVLDSLFRKINNLKPHQQKELLALGYYLQGNLSTTEELEYIKKILRSYLAKIAQF